MQIKKHWQPGILAAGLTVGVGVLLAQDKAAPSSYAPVDIHETFTSIMTRMSAAEDEINKRQTTLLEERYDLSDRAAPGSTMSRNKPIQQGVRVKLARHLSRRVSATSSPQPRGRRHAVPERGN